MPSTDDTICDQAHQHLKSQFADFQDVARLLQFNGQQYLAGHRSMSLLENLCRAIAGQQLSTKAAATIWGRVKSMQKVCNSAFTAFAATASTEQLRECGLSNAKTRTIKELGEAAATGQLNANRLRHLPTDELVDYLCQFWGVGRWTAQMSAISYFRHADVWSEGDVGLQNALQKLYPDNQDAQLQCVAISSPFRSYWSLHLWSALDNGYFNQLTVHR